jgi:hypothetical protein
MYVVPLFAPNDIWITQHVTGVGGSKVGRLSESALQRPRGPGLFSLLCVCVSMPSVRSNINNIIRLLFWVARFESPVIVLK